MKRYLLSVSLQLSIVLLGYGHFAKTEESSDAPTPPAAATAAEPKCQKLPDTIRITRAPDLSTLSPSDSQYKVVCDIISDSLSFHTPEVVARDGECVKMSDTSETTFTIAMKQDGEVAVPITRKLHEGSVFEFTVLSLDDEKVLVDLSANLQSVDSGKSQEIRESLQVNTVTGRFIKTVRIGEKTSASFGDKDQWQLQITVERAVDAPAMPIVK
ncbi:hypothetical protein [Aeoliella mucimassa]|uniref:Uncharacterized protein n=1 Tax=Aeoliella mucimassa TaxID=2527972 RepID=A0A518AVY6_9BACT|nr:hypothetical protein [Aeoliella mucimassa]QDU58895.1 hypothetical protein Pan181_51360 [Aeoliella mucimassa]